MGISPQFVIVDCKDCIYFREGDDVECTFFTIRIKNGICQEFKINMNESVVEEDT